MDFRNEKWFDEKEYPFKSNYFNIDGHRMHYIDEGQGEVLLFIHGTPTWSFLYRNMIKELSGEYRCIAVDHIGFGFSDKPDGYDYRPEKLAENLELFINGLSLDGFNLIVHDFGGPIGLSYAIKYPEKIKRQIVFNTWMWETASDPGVRKINNIATKWIGRFLFLNMNFSPKVLLKKSFSDSSKITSKIHAYYKNVFRNKSERHATLGMAKSLYGSSDWYAALWNNRHLISGKKTLFIWGMKDVFFKKEFLEKWKNEWSDFSVLELECGHFPQEESPGRTTAAILGFLSK